MTVATETNQVSYTGNGVTTAFAFPYVFHAQADIVVVETIIATGAQSIKTLTTDYTISGTPDALGHYPTGGTIDAVLAPAGTVTWTIYNDPDVTQPLDLVENDPLPAESLEAAYDRVTLICQRLKKLIGRALRQPDGDVADIGVLPAKADRISKYLGFDADGDPIATAGTSDATIVSSFMATVLDDTSAAAARVTLGAGTGNGDVASTRQIATPAAGGIAGGGTLAADRSFSLAPAGMTQVVPAPADMVPAADASDSNNPKKISVLAIAGRSPSAKLVLSPAQGVAGGTSTGSAWTKYPLSSTPEYDADSIAPVASSQITLLAGTYDLDIEITVAMTANTGRARIAFVNVTDGTFPVIGVQTGASDAGADYCNPRLRGRVTIAATKVFEVQYYTTFGKSTDGLGAAFNEGGHVETYGYCIITKVAD